MEMYRTAENTIHTKLQDSLILNTPQLQQKAALRSRLAFGNTRTKKKDFDKTHAKIISGFYEKGEHGMICSQYTIKAFIGTTVEFENRLKKEFPELAQEKRLTNLKGLEYEKLKNILPERVVKVLSKGGIIKPLGPTPTESKIFRESSTPTPEAMAG
jgi:hypothetical protein